MATYSQQFLSVYCIGYFLIEEVVLLPHLFTPGSCEIGTHSVTICTSTPFKKKVQSSKWIKGETKESNKDIVDDIKIGYITVA